MKGSRFRGEQIVGVLKEGEAGVPMKDLYRRISVSTATFYHWKASPEIARSTQFFRNLLGYFPYSAIR